MTYKVGPKGQVVLPKAIRDRHGIEPGDEVSVDDRGDGILIRPVRRSVRLLGMLADPTDRVPLTRVLELERRVERAREEQKIAEGALRSART